MILTRHCKAFIAFHIGLAIWSFMTVPVLFAESFSGRPSPAELEATVTLGMVCARGVNERCYATQTSTNPTYSVSPPDFAGTNGGWYLDNNLMSNLDLKATNLVPCYVDDNTVYDGTTNIVMLAVTGLWAQLEIGDRTNQFTGTPAIGTNSATYGDYPWRIYVTNLQERYTVLNALKTLPAMPYWGGVNAGTNFGIVISRNVKYGGTIQYQHPINYIYHGIASNVGVANGTLHDIEMSSIAWDGWNSDHRIIMGKAVPYLVSSWGVQDVGNGVMQFDTNPSTNISSFSAELIFSADTEFVRILNCKADTQIGCNNIESSYTESTINISADLDEANFGTIFFEWWQVLEYPFKYCTSP